MRTKEQEAERYRGKCWARALSSRDLGMLMDALVLGEWDWRDWFLDKPSKAFLAGAFDEAELLEQGAA